MPACPPTIVSGAADTATRIAGTMPSSRSTCHTSGEATSSTSPRPSEARSDSRSMAGAIIETFSGLAAIRRAAVACSPSWTTATTRSSAISDATAPYAAGPSARAATIWKPYVDTFMTRIAIAIPPLPWIRARIREGRPASSVVTKRA